MIFIPAGSTSTQLNSLTENITDTLNSCAVYFQFPTHFLQTKKKFTSHRQPQSDSMVTL